MNVTYRLFLHSRRTVWRNIDETVVLQNGEDCTLVEDRPSINVDNVTPIRTT